MGLNTVISSNELYERLKKSKIFGDDFPEDVVKMTITLEVNKLAVIEVLYNPKYEGMNSEVIECKKFKLIEDDG
jgi:hypothetical protein